MESVAAPKSSSNIQKTTLATAVEAAWSRAVASAEAAGISRQAAAEKQASSALWAAPPSVELSHRNDRLQSNNGARETEVALAVPLWLPGQKSAKQQAADSLSSLSQLSETEGKLRVAEVVRELHWQIAELQASQSLSKQQTSTFAAIASDVDKRVKAGDLARADALAAKGELLSAQATQSQAETQLEAAKRQWTALTGLAQTPDATFASAESPSPRQLAEHPELLRAEQQVDLARKRLDLVAKSNRSAPELITKFRQDIPGHGQGSAYSLGLAVRIPFGTDDRNAPLQAAALTELDIAQRKEQVLRAQLSARMESAKAAAAASQLQLQTEREKAALLNERAKLIRAAFNAGETSLPELLRAASAAAQADYSAARQEAAFGLARARLQQAYGQLP
ncbi:MULTISPECIES: TolC family protein [Comamonas]|nr:MULTISPECIES: TolC family protein [Comamonas]PIG08930.1 outer membrane protein TolC [Comamonas sp. 26]MDH1477795.1 TolC family protein [Comamonas thiooxydans]QQN68852.1 TolC family protein [Comamonas testosteroni]TFF54223.1 TolC family protein [Comamonas sp. A23]TYK69095.1 TolC family protein [Comamonas sp. Z1]